MSMTSGMMPEPPEITGKWMRKKDERPYEVLTVARGFDSDTHYWTNFLVICKPLDGNYSAYAIPFIEFYRDFRKLTSDDTNGHVRRR